MKAFPNQSSFCLNRVKSYGQINEGQIITPLKGRIFAVFKITTTMI